MVRPQPSALRALLCPVTRALRASPAGFRLVRQPEVQFWASDVVPDELLGRVRSMAEAGTASGAQRLAAPAAAGGSGSMILKIYRPRPSHGLVRRLRASRALREGLGYLVFAARGIPTPRPLLFGEARRRELLRWHVIATLEVPAPPVSRAFLDSGDVRELEAALDALAAIHRAGLCHGDALARNFLALRPVPLAFDMPSWGWLTPSLREKDLLRLLASVSRLTGGDAVGAALLARYARAFPDVRLPRPAVLLARAAAEATARDVARDAEREAAGSAPEPPAQ